MLIRARDGAAGRRQCTGTLLDQGRPDGDSRKRERNSARNHHRTTGTQGTEPRKTDSGTGGVGAECEYVYSSNRV